MIGPYDLSCSMGLAGQWAHSEVIAVLDEVCEKTRNAGILLGAYAETDLSRWIKKRQIQYLGCINDTGALMTGFQQRIKEVKSCLQPASHEQQTN